MDSNRPLVLILITKADVGGAQVHVLDILKGLQSCYQFVLGVGETDFLSQEAEKLGIEVRVLKHLKRPISFVEDRAGLLECIALFKELKPDLLHLHSSKAGVLGRLAAWRLGIPCLFTAHGWAFTEGVPKTRKLYGLVAEFVLARLTGNVITISSYDYELADRYRVGSRSKRFLVKNGISPPRVAVATAKTELTNILSIGRLNGTQKNQLMMLKALALLRIPFQAKIIGEGELREELARSIRALKLEDKVELLGEVIDTSLYLAEADMFVLSSNYEGLPLSVLEAMSMGVPVVSTDVGGVAEAVIHGRTGYLSKRHDAEQLARNIESLACDPARREQFGTAAVAHYEANFTVDRMLDELDAVYQQTLAEQ